MKILILQFRTDQSGWHEIKCLYEGLGVSYENLTFVNVSSEAESQSSILDAVSRADKVIIGGLAESGFEATEPEQRNHIQSLIDKVSPSIKFLLSNNTPTLGICFGHQLIAHILGAKITTDKKYAESDTVEIQLTDEGKVDPIFKGLENNKVFAIEGHKSSVLELPDGAVHLAKTDKCPINCFRYGKNTYGLQFHAELSRQDYLDRVALYPAYLENIVNSDSDIQNVDLNAKIILKNFASL